MKHQKEISELWIPVTKQIKESIGKINESVKYLFFIFSCLLLFLLFLSYIIDSALLLFYMNLCEYN